MRIIFNLVGTGLGDNGGSSTIVLSANILNKLGHEVYIVDSSINKHTWNIIEVPHIVIKSEKDIPDSDVIIATGSNSIKHTLNSPTRCGKKFHYIRAWESWKYSENKLIETLKLPLIKIVNSICLQNKLKSFGFESFIIRPGNSFEQFRVNRKKRDVIKLGGLYNTRHKTKRSEWLLQAIDTIQISNKNTQLNLFGMHNKPNLKNYCNYYQNPNQKTKEEIYNDTDIWLSTSILEGLHIPPQEAMLTECTVVGTDAEMSGTQDYLINDKTSIVSSNNFDSFISNIKNLINDRELRIKLGKAGRDKIIELGNREDNMKKLVYFLERNIK